jgi:hypothetical protein
MFSANSVPSPEAQVVLGCDCGRSCSDLSTCDSWKCSCGNTTLRDGFHACNRLGEEVEPLRESWIDSLYVCGTCHMIYSQGTRVAVGRA